MSFNISQLDTWVEQIANGRNEYILSASLLELFDEISPCEASLFANVRSDASNARFRVTKWFGNNPTFLRRCFTRLEREGFFDKDFTAIRQAEIGKKFFYFIPVICQSNLVSVIAIQSKEIYVEETLDMFWMLANHAARTIERRRLAEWASVTDMMIYILEPIFASKDMHSLVTNIKKSVLTLLGVDKAAVYIEGFEDLNESDSLEASLAKESYEAQLPWMGTVGQYLEENPEIQLSDLPEKMRSILTVPIMDESGQCIGGLASAYYFTDLAFDEVDKKLFELYAAKIYRAIVNKSQLMQLEQSNKHLEKLDEVKEKTINEVTHDLKTPIGAIRGFAELLLMTEQSEESKKLFIEHIHKASDSLLTMVQDILELAKLKVTGQFQLKEFQICDIEQIVRDLCFGASGISQEHNIELNASDKIPLISIDAKAIIRVINNLLSNAIKYSPKGGKVTVAMRLIHKEAISFVEIAVSDEGLGIPADKLENLFQSFTRVDTKEHMMVDGTGLGLAICKEIVQAHHGDITVASEHGAGTTFSFTLPLETAMNCAS